MLRGLASAAALCALGATVLGAAGQQALTKREADSLEKKLAAMLARGAQATAAPKALRTPVSDREVNAYFKYQGAAVLPVGVVNPSVGIQETGRLTGVVTVDLDAVRKSKERAWTDPMAYVTGALEVRLAGRLTASNGKGQFILESATLAGVPMPKAFLQEIVAFYTRTPELPAGFNLDQPFDLPQRIRQVDFQRGTAVIVQ